MAFIYETDNFIIESVDKPLVTRMDGGHLTITPKERISDRTKFSPMRAKEFIKLSMIVGEAMTVALNERGVDVGRINYQDNGNWGVFTPQGPHCHLHLYGRAKSAKIQKYGESCYFPMLSTGFYDTFEPLNEGDIAAVRKQIEMILRNPKYDASLW